MEEKIIRKDRLKTVLTNLVKTYRVIAPVRKDASVVFESVRSGDDIWLSDANTKKSVKEIFFPQREQLFSYNKEDIKAPAFLDKKQIVFGVRPCDARSLSVFTPVFDADAYKDPYYINKRDNTIFIAIGCNQPASTCFCNAVGGGPFSHDGVDILLVDTGDAYVVQVLSEKGEACLKDLNELEPADENHARSKDEMMEKAQSAMTFSLDTDAIKAKLDSGFNSTIWDSVYEKCLGCGICTFLCPTCHCFDIQDEGETAGERIRIWDSCMFPQFTLHASGGNPRKTGKERMRQRIMHKFKYFVDNNNTIACTGCGRCVRYCPVNLDIREILKQVQES